MSFDGSSLVVRICAWTTLVLASSIAAADPLVSGTLEVRQTVQCCYREGAVSYVNVRQLGNDKATLHASRLLAPLDPTLIVGTELSPGRYVISSFQRPCDGNCNVLNPPVDECNSSLIELRAGMTVSVLVSVIPFGGCTISAETGSI